MKSKIFLAAALIAAANFAQALPIRAAERVLTLDPSTSQVGFDLEATGEDVHGLFHLQQGEIVFDTETGLASGDIVVEAFGANTGSKKRDKTMHKKVLESEEFPLIVFHCQNVDGEIPDSGAGEVELQGTMTLLGVEHPMTMNAAIDVDGDRVQAKTEFPVPFVDWGLHDPSFLMLKVAKIVSVKVDAEGTLATAPAESLPAGGV